MASDFSHYIPRRLDDSGKFIFWAVDTAMVAMTVLFLGFALGYNVTGFLGGIALAYGYSKLKASRHPGTAVHLAYWCIGIPGLQELPASFWRQMKG